MKIAYVRKKFRPETLERIEIAISIIETYREAGYVLTVRQLYYQFVARGLIPNTTREYNRLKGFVSDARMAGLIDWDAIEDRTREVRYRPTWSSPAELVGACAKQYAVDPWLDQDVYVEVWVEKEALVGVFAPVCRSLYVPYLACRGYVSQSEMWRAATYRFMRSGRRNVILHFGDHDPSGIDMTRDVRDRLLIFGVDVEVRRIALNLDQVETWDPPPNPAKTTDSRFLEYRRLFGDESWELDALEPSILEELVESEVVALRDPSTWATSLARGERGRDELEVIANGYGSVVDALELG